MGGITKDGAQARFGAVVLAVGHRYLPPVLDSELLPSILRKDSVSARHGSAVSGMGRIPQIRGLAVVREYRRSRHILLSLSRHRIPGDTRRKNNSAVESLLSVRNPVPGSPAVSCVLPA